MKQVRREYQFYGRVQGVGFRYQACLAAQMLGITGWVRNCSDGSVRAQAQGNQLALRDFVLLLKKERFIRIDSMDCKDVALKDKERGFKIFY